jgi:hypothetical protein
MSGSEAKTVKPVDPGRLDFASLKHWTLIGQCRWLTLTTTSRHLRRGVCEPKALSAIA